MAVNPTIEAILEKLGDIQDAITANSPTAIVDAIDITNAKLDSISNGIVDVQGHLFTIEGQNDALYEKTNTMAFDVGLAKDYLNTIAGWDIPAKIDAIQAYLDDIDGPMQEAHLFALREAIGALQVLNCMCDVSANPSLPQPTTDAPAEDDVHCHRTRYYIGRLTIRISDVIDWINRGVQLGNDAIAYLFGFNVVPGISSTNITPDLRLGLTGLLAHGAVILLGQIHDWVNDHTEALVDIIYSAANAESAANAIYSYVDAQLPSLTDVPLRTAIKAFFSTGALNAIFDQSVVWDTSEYDSETCGGGFTPSLLTSQNVDIVSEGPPTQMSSTLYGVQSRIFWGGLAGVTFQFDDLWSIAEGGFSVGADIGAATKYVTWVNDNYHNYRVRLIGSLPNIQIWRHEGAEANLDNNWYRFTDVTDYWAIVNIDAPTSFQVEIQQLVGGVWGPAF